jgi:predicted ArsR family transcriptional regulator
VTEIFAALPPAQQTILKALKGEGPQPIRDLASGLGVTYEAARQQLADLEQGGWVRSEPERVRAPGAGRPRRLFALTPAGDHLFPKRYDDLAVEVLDAIVERLGAETVKGLLASLAEARVRRFAPKIASLPLAEKLEALRGVYLDEDPFISVETLTDGTLRLVERNCPFLSIASRRPALCSVTVSVLSQLLGCKVLREERFQRGDGRCVFRVLADQPLSGTETGFHWEPDVP